MSALFMYHAGHKALVFPDPNKMGFDKNGNFVVQGYIAFPVAIMREFGWRVTEDGLARTLPSYGMPLIVPPAAVGMDPKKMQQLQKALRGGRR